MLYRNYEYGINVLLGINIILLLLNKMGDITIYWDWCEAALWILWVFILVMVPYKKAWYILLGRGVSVLGIIVVVLIVYVKNIDTAYGNIKSPQHTSEVILKRTSEGGLHHRYYNLELYKRVGIIFKKDLHQKIYEYDVPLFIGEGISQINLNSYEAEYGLHMIWQSEETLHVYIDKEKKRADEIVDIIVNLE